MEHRAKDVAIVGMAGRFPGAADVDQFWSNLADGVESIGRFTEDEVLSCGVDPDLVANPDYVRARPVLDDVRGFDAAFFNYSPREALISDPQQRVFLECAWSALEQAGYPVPEERGRVGVFAGVNMSTYMLDRFEQFQDELSANIYEIIMGNDKDSLATMVSYKLGFTGPSVSVQTFCSSSLVGVHLACRSLQNGECELALAGGVSIRVPDRVGHLYQPGGMESPDGHVRTFDADARGSMFGDGAAVVLLKPLRQAVADRDTVLAVIRGSAMNNDGSLKFGYTAPSVMGQAQAVRDALADACVEAGEISYVEAHGTATELGDPMEVAALTRAFGPVERKQYCAIGSVKTNVGHLDRAAGVTGLIKVVQAMRHGALPRTLHFRQPNPEIDFADSPFRVTDELTPWPRDDGRRRLAGVNSLGMGGTNVHVIVEEAPDVPLQPGRRHPRRHQVLPVSARSEKAATDACAALAGHLRAHPELDLADVAYTLQAGRQSFEHRRVVTALSADEAGAALAPAEGEESPAAHRRMLQRVDGTQGRPVALLIAGVGEHYPGMVSGLYRHEPDFRAAVEECCRLVGGERGREILRVLTDSDASSDAGEQPADLARLMGRTVGHDGAPVQAMHRTEIAQPAVFVAEYSLARTLLDWGVSPRLMIGYSVGEYVAACLAGVLTLPDALRLVCRRADLIAGLPAGAMLGLSLTEQEFRQRFPDAGQRGLDVAATTGQQLVVAGPPESVGELARELRAKEVPCRELDTTHAFHSRMLEPVAEELHTWIADTIRLNGPRLPYVSNVTGSLATEELVTDPQYWSRHMCSTVRFGEGLATALLDPASAFVEIGAGQSLGAMLRAHPDCDRDRWSLVIPTLPALSDRQPDDAALTSAVARMWLAGVSIDWSAYHGVADGREALWRRPGRVPLPTYPFQHQEYWIEPTRPRLSRPAEQTAPEPKNLMSALSGLPRREEDQWLEVPVWRQTAPPAAAPPAQRWLVYTDGGLADEVAQALLVSLRDAGVEVVCVQPGDRFLPGEEMCAIRPGNARDAVSLLTHLRQRDLLPDRVVHLWTLADLTEQPEADRVREMARRGLHTLVGLAQACGEVGWDSWSLDIVTAGSQHVLPGDRVAPEQALALGACRLFPVEYPGVRARLVDIGGDAQRAGDGANLLTELLAEPSEALVALRGHRRWLPGFDVLRTPVLDGEADSRPGRPSGGTAGPVRHNGVYLITGGLGGIGLALAERLAQHRAARLVLFGRTPVPPRDQWESLLTREDTPAEVRRRLTGLLGLERRGAEVAVVCGDMARPEDVKRAVDVALDRFGELNGVLHAAGVPGVGLIQFKTAAEIDRVLAPKVAGTLALADALTGVNPDRLDFVALFSSITSATGGGPGQLDYCAANAYLDAFCHAGRLGTTRMVAIDWGEWTWNGWTDGLDGYDPVMRTFFEEHRERFGITFDQGWRSLQRALASGEAQVVVSTQDFQSMVDISRRYTVNDLHTATQDERADGSRHPRPDLVTSFVLPRSRQERTIAEIWAESLGLAEVGIADNFFELGGNSLIGVNIVARIRRELELDHLPPHVLYEAPTVEALAARACGDGGPERRSSTEERAVERQKRIEMRRRSLGREGAA